MDNRFYKCKWPARMSDGRFVTNHINQDVFNQFVAQSNNIKTSHQYRDFLQKNATTIINNERQFFINKYNRNLKCE